MQSFCDKAFGNVWPVGIRCVDERDAKFNRTP